MRKVIVSAVSPAIITVKEVHKTHRYIWDTLVWKKWDALPFESKLVWILVVNHTLAIFILFTKLIFG